MRTLLRIVLPLIIISLFTLGILFPTIADMFGGITTVVSFLIVLLTYFYVILTGEIVRQMVKVQEEENRPYILGHIEFDKHQGWIVVSNVGKKPAQDLTIKIEPPLIGTRNTDIGPKLFSKPISFFPPGKVFRSWVDSRDQIFKEGFIDEYKFIISYTWKGCKEPVTEEYITNISFYKGRWGIDERDINDIAETLESIDRHLATIAKKSPRDHNK